MNILPKKNWHVRTRKNIDKVRKDEAKAAEEERKLSERIALAEREARTEFLRSRAKTGPSSTTIKPEPSAHVDLFADSQLGRGDQRINLEHEKEEKLRTEKWEQQVGILTYLHKSQSDVDNPWYLQPHEQRLLGESKDDSLAGGKKDDLNHYHDPLVTMRQYLSKMKSSESDKSMEKSCRKSMHESITKERTEHVKIKNEPGDKMTQLRQQRLERERKERERAEQVIRKHRISNGLTPCPSSTKSTPRAVDERKMRFNSQFNPQLSRR